ncbi:MAG TPA: low temperature requirement protein A [Ktedonobacterales bacterium]|nr:low temperature requirement protein A [Ktedonobacterales bacterium]
MQRQDARNDEPMRVSTIESFFDLVFVFTITQLTHLVEQARRPLDFLLVLLVLMLIWWMYDGYTWLTNTTGAGRRMRLVLIAAMAGFLVMAIVLPGVFGADGLIFGLAYLYVIVIHSIAFLVQGGRSAARAMLGIAPLNVVAALLVILAGLVHTDWNWLFFLAAVVPFVLVTILRRERGVSVNSAHFVERHGLVILIVLGESIVDIGTGAADHALDLSTFAAIVLALILIAALWWTYFDRDDERAREVMESASSDARSRLALLGYWYTHLAMIAGVVLIATGVKEVIADDKESMTRAVWFLASGLAIYLAGDVWFRRAMGIRPVAVRAVGAVVALLIGIIGPLGSGAASLGAVTALAIVIVVAEEQLRGEKEVAAT